MKFSNVGSVSAATMGQSGGTVLELIYTGSLPCTQVIEDGDRPKSPQC